MAEIKSKKYFWTTTTTLSLLLFLFIIDTVNCQKNYPGSIQDIIAQIKTENNNFHSKDRQPQRPHIQSRNQLEQSEESPEDENEEEEVISERVSTHHQWPFLFRQPLYPKPRLPQYSPLPWLDLDEIERTGGQLVLRSIFPNQGPPPPPPPPVTAAPKPVTRFVPQKPPPIFEPAPRFVPQPPPPIFEPAPRFVPQPPPPIFEPAPRFVPQQPPPIFEPAPRFVPQKPPPVFEPSPSYLTNYPANPEIAQSTAVWSDYYPSQPQNPSSDAATFDSNFLKSIAFEENSLPNFLIQDDPQNYKNSNTGGAITPTYPLTRAFQVHPTSNFPAISTSTSGQVKWENLYQNHPPTTTNNAFQPLLPLNSEDGSGGSFKILTSNSNFPLRSSVAPHKNSGAWTSAAAASNYLMRPKPQFKSTSVVSQPTYTTVHQPSSNSYHGNHRPGRPITVTAHHRQIYRTPPQPTAVNSNQQDNNNNSPEFNFPKLVEYEHHYYVTPENQIVPTGNRNHGNGHVMGLHGSTPSRSYSTYHHVGQ